MAERRADGDVQVGVYDSGKPAATVRDTRTPYQDHTDVVVETPVDLVRWGPIIAGIFAALSTLAALTVLGLAIGASAFDGSDTAGEATRNLGLGAGIWGAISTLISFFVGGLIASRAAAVRNRNSGMLNGAMVWFVAIPLLLSLLGSGIGALTQAAGSIAGTAAQVAAPVAGQAADDPALQATAQVGAENLGADAQATAQALAEQVTPERVEQAADATSRGAWGTLLSLGLAALASILGGIVGSRPRAVARTVRA